MQVQGFNHVTINVSDLKQSLHFYCDILGMVLRHKGETDAYLEWGDAWVCLIERRHCRPSEQKQLGTDHIAFYILQDDFHNAVETLKENQIKIVRAPIQRGTGWTVNFLDPDGTEFELHTATLDERMKVWK